MKDTGNSTSSLIGLSLVSFAFSCVHDRAHGLALLLIRPLLLLEASFAEHSVAIILQVVGTRVAVSRLAHITKTHELSCADVIVEIQAIATNRLAYSASARPILCRVGPLAFRTLTTNALLTKE